MTCNNIRMQLKKRKADYHHGNLRAALIQCGIKLIEEKGIPALSLREIGKRCVFREPQPTRTSKIRPP
jgi:AcrR family transcriptional regulator